MTCPHCGSHKLFGPAIIVSEFGVEYEYYDCARCHTLILVNPVSGELQAKAGAW